MAQVAELPTISPLLSHIAVTQIGQDGLPRKTSATDEERDAYHLAEAEIRHMQVFAGMHVEVLRRIGERWSPIDEQELATFFGQHNHVTEETASTLARGFIRFFNGDHEGAAFSVMPRIENCPRPPTPDGCRGVQASARHFSRDVLRSWSALPDAR